MTTIGATAVGVTAIRNNLKFWTIINIGSPIILWWSLFQLKSFCINIAFLNWKLLKRFKIWHITLFQSLLEVSSFATGNLSIYRLIHIFQVVILLNSKYLILNFYKAIQGLVNLTGIFVHFAYSQLLALV